MTQNPREDDLDELRRMARERGAEAGGPAGRESSFQYLRPGGAGDVPARSADRAGLYRELLPLDGAATAQKPYLEGLPENYSGEHLVFEWIEHLLSGGYLGAAEALDYYEAIGWITPGVRAELEEYLRGVADPTTPEDGLDVDGHMRSLVYVAELASLA
ncbi:MAG: FlaD/FlaE family flagellar protein [Haloarculaceae archaeon]